jgi:hypothetical protein
LNFDLVVLLSPSLKKVGAARLNNIKEKGE